MVAGGGGGGLLGGVYDGCDPQPVRASTAAKCVANRRLKARRRTELRNANKMDATDFAVVIVNAASRSPLLAFFAPNGLLLWT